MLSKQEIVTNFILNVEKERVRCKQTQAPMSKKLDMSLSCYKKKKFLFLRRTNPEKILLLFLSPPEIWKTV